MNNKAEYVTAYAVIRVDDGPVDSESRVREYVSDGVVLPAAGPWSVTVKEIVMSASEAQCEVARLNQLNSTKSCKYYWQVTHVFLGGGSHGSAARQLGDNLDHA